MKGENWHMEYRQAHQITMPGTADNDLNPLGLLSAWRRAQEGPTGAVACAGCGAHRWARGQCDYCGRKR